MLFNTKVTMSEIMCWLNGVVKLSIWSDSKMCEDYRQHFLGKLQQM